jgi:hypothetical protein
MLQEKPQAHIETFKKLGSSLFSLPFWELFSIELPGSECKVPVPTLCST